MLQKNGSFEVMVANEVLVLAPERAIYWPREQALVFSDLHLGKSAHFRKHGIPIPALVQQRDLQVLEKLILQFVPKILIVVGDMFHQDFNGDVGLFKTWRQNFADLRILLVQGNHDRIAKACHQELEIELVDDALSLGSFVFSHDIKDCESSRFSICGHIHPGVLLFGQARQHLRLPCFAVGKNHLILPAFSQFTGLDTGHTANNTYQCYAIGGGRVWKV